MRPAGENLLDEGGGVWPDGRAPPDQARWAPLQMRAMGVGHVLRNGGKPAHLMTAAMDPEPSASLKHFDGGGRQPHVERLVDQPIRHRVVMTVDVDVVVNIHADLAPLGVDEALGG